jgi:hypothetical protein
MVAVVEALTMEDVAVNVALVLPADTATVEGTVTAEELLLKLTDVPPVGAGPVNVTVPCELDPPITEVGDKAIEFKATAAGVRVSVAVCVALA